MLLENRALHSFFIEWGARGFLIVYCFFCDEVLLEFPIISSVVSTWCTSGLRASPKVCDCPICALAPRRVACRALQYPGVDLTATRASRPCLPAAEVRERLTYGEMDKTHKNKISHRALALKEVKKMTDQYKARMSPAKHTKQGPCGVGGT